MAAEVCTSTTERMRPGAVTVKEIDMDEMVLEEQNEMMREHIAAVRSHAELMAMEGEPIRVRPRVIDAQRATTMGETGSSNETPLRYVRQWPDIH
eukprot:16434120-Heterocapsa_arctica.AAC.1